MSEEFISAEERQYNELENFDMDELEEDENECEECGEQLEDCTCDTDLDEG